MFLKQTFFLFTVSLILVKAIRYKPNWESLDSRPLPTWYDEAKIGIFIHWGVFSVPSFGDEWFWKFWKDGKPPYVKFMTKNYKPGFEYQDFGPMFTAEFFNPDQWAEIFQASGAKYVVLTSKHHEGFTMWPSKHSFGWNSVDIGPHRDLVGELAISIKKSKDLHFGLYHSLYEWFNPLLQVDSRNDFETQLFVDQKTLPELYELVTNYEPEVIWSDGEMPANDTYWKSKEFLAWLFNDSPVKNEVVVNDRWGIGTACHHGSFYTCADRYNPGTLQPHKWENAMTLDKKSWGFRRDAQLSDYLTIEELLQNLIETVSCGGNLLVNIGPTHDGRISPIMEERLRQMGHWLSLNGEAIYSSSPWKAQNDSVTQGIWYTQNERKNQVFAMINNWPEDEFVLLGNVKSSIDSSIHLIGFSDALQFKNLEKGTAVIFPDMKKSKSQWVHVLRMEQVKWNP